MLNNVLILFVFCGQIMGKHNHQDSSTEKERKKLAADYIESKFNNLNKIG